MEPMYRVICVHLLKIVQPDGGMGEVVQYHAENVDGPIQVMSFTGPVGVQLYQPGDMLTFSVTAQKPRVRQ